MSAHYFVLHDLLFALLNCVKGFALSQASNMALGTAAASRISNTAGQEATERLSGILELKP